MAASIQTKGGGRREISLDQSSNLAARLPSAVGLSYALWGRPPCSAPTRCQMQTQNCDNHTCPQTLPGIPS